ncbi:MAG: toll/interleukin-1 receptor domain-containing protein [Sphingomicrobium sp.]
MPKLARVQEWDRGRGSGPDSRPARAHSLKYYAFLSYSHADEATADWLHEALERFRTPSALAGRLTDNGVIPRRLTPVFRDRHELPASADLADGIRDALDGSRFLIVLCSPTAAASHWVNAEIDMFKRHRPDGCVLVAILDGKPFASEIPGREAEECFPPALRHRYDRRGRPTARRAEPLAADLRDDHDGRRLGLLKLVAGMLGVGLDEIVQRETLRRQRRLAIVAAASLAGMALTSTLSVFALQSRNEARDQRKEAESLVGFMLGDLRSKLEPLGRLDVLDSVGQRALAYYQSQDKGSLSDDSLAQRSKALTLMGEIANTRGNLDTALRLYREALAGTAEALRRAPNNPQRLFDHAQNVYWVGYIDWQRGRLDRAESAFREYQQLAAQMIALEPNQPKWRLEAKYADSTLGTVLVDQRRFSDAASAFQKSLSASEVLAASAPDNRNNQVALLEALAWLSEAREKEGRLEDALAQRERQIAILDRLIAAHGGDAEYRRKAMSAHTAMGRLLASRGDLTAGLKEARLANMYADQLVASEPNNTEWMEFAAVSKLEFGDLLLAAKVVEASASAVRSGCDMAARLIAKDSSVLSWRDGLRRSCLRRRAEIALARGAPEEAVALSRQMLNVAKANQNASPIDGAIAVASADQLVGDALQASGNSQSARQSWRTAADEWPKGAMLTPYELGRFAILMQRIGNLGEGARIKDRLAGMGYRHPQYLRSITEGVS